MHLLPSLHMIGIRLHVGEENKHGRGQSNLSQLPVSLTNQINLGCILIVVCCPQFLSKTSSSSCTPVSVVRIQSRKLCRANKANEKYSSAVPQVSRCPLWRTFYICILLTCRLPSLQNYQQSQYSECHEKCYGIFSANNVNVIFTFR